MKPLGTLVKWDGWTDVPSALSPHKTTTRGVWGRSTSGAPLPVIARASSARFRLSSSLGQLLVCLTGTPSGHRHSSPAVQSVTRVTFPTSFPTTEAGSQSSVLKKIGQSSCVQITYFLLKSYTLVSAVAT